MLGFGLTVVVVFKVVRLNISQDSVLFVGWLQGGTMSDSVAMCLQDLMSCATDAGIEVLASLGILDCRCLHDFPFGFQFNRTN